MREEYKITSNTDDSAKKDKEGGTTEAANTENATNLSQEDPSLVEASELASLSETKEVDGQTNSEVHSDQSDGKEKSLAAVQKDGDPSHEMTFSSDLTCGQVPHEESLRPEPQTQHEDPEGQVTLIISDGANDETASGEEGLSLEIKVIPENESLSEFQDEGTTNVRQESSAIRSGECSDDDDEMLNGSDKVPFDSEGSDKADDIDAAEESNVKEEAEEEASVEDVVDSKASDVAAVDEALCPNDSCDYDHF